MTTTAPNPELAAAVTALTDGYADLLSLLWHAIETRADEALGYVDFHDYLTTEFGATLALIGLTADQAIVGAVVTGRSR